MYSFSDNHVSEPLRNPVFLQQQALLVGEDPSVDQMLRGQEVGICFYSEVNEWPGFRLTNSIASDYMHGGVYGEDKKHFLVFMEEMRRLNRNVWPQLSDTIRQILTSNRLSPVRKFGTDAGFNTLVTHDIMKVIEYSPVALYTIGIPPELADKWTLFCLQSEFMSILTDHEISAGQLSYCSTIFQFIKFRGLRYYTGNENESWITINSHIISHTEHYVKRFGVCRASWVFSMESQLGIMKRYLDKHRNGVSEGYAMLRNFWLTIACYYLLKKIKRPSPTSEVIRENDVLRIADCIVRVTTLNDNNELAVKRCETALSTVFGGKLESSLELVGPAFLINRNTVQSRFIIVRTGFKFVLWKELSYMNK